eukprot:gnl/Chilomastix_cuspidata/6228.p1 GENE.gnl/Chilomastix_cuspidata/6228~~gnl/Chilomastix_cuspidata/6228.p1  ORF type:complete len:1281 (-),score=306.44 gnl/Chilomastix_cuspidata/6228:37-3879(-)
MQRSRPCPAFEHLSFLSGKYSLPEESVIFPGLPFYPILTLPASDGIHSKRDIYAFDDSRNLKPARKHKPLTGSVFLPATFLISLDSPPQFTAPRRSARRQRTSAPCSPRSPQTPMSPLSPRQANGRPEPWSAEPPPSEPPLFSQGPSIAYFESSQHAVEQLRDVSLSFMLDRLCARRSALRIPAFAAEPARNAAAPQLRWPDADSKDSIAAVLKIPDFDVTVDGTGVPAANHVRLLNELELCEVATWFYFQHSRHAESRAEMMAEWEPCEVSDDLRDITSNDAEDTPATPSNPFAERPRFWPFTYPPPRAPICLRGARSFVLQEFVLPLGARPATLRALWTRGGKPKFWVLASKTEFPQHRPPWAAGRPEKQDPRTSCLSPSSSTSHLHKGSERPQDSLAQKLGNFRCPDDTTVSSEDFHLSLPQFSQSEEPAQSHKPLSVVKTLPRRRQSSRSNLAKHSAGASSLLVPERAPQVFVTQPLIAPRPATPAKDALDVMRALPLRGLTLPASPRSQHPSNPPTPPTSPHGKRGVSSDPQKLKTLSPSSSMKALLDLVPLLPPSKIFPAILRVRAPTGASSPLSSVPARLEHIARQVETLCGEPPEELVADLVWTEGGQTATLARFPDGQFQLTLSCSPGPRWALLQVKAISLPASLKQVLSHTRCVGGGRGGRAPPRELERYEQTALAKITARLPHVHWWEEAPEQAAGGPPRAIAQGEAPFLPEQTRFPVHVREPMSSFAKKPQINSDLFPPCPFCDGPLFACSAAVSFTHMRDATQFANERGAVVPLKLLENVSRHWRGDLRASGTGGAASPQASAAMACCNLCAAFVSSELHLRAVLESWADALSGPFEDEPDVSARAARAVSAAALFNTPKPAPSPQRKLQPNASFEVASPRTPGPPQAHKGASPPSVPKAPKLEVFRVTFAITNVSAPYLPWGLGAAVPGFEPAVAVGHAPGARVAPERQIFEINFLGHKFNVPISGPSVRREAAAQVIGGADAPNATLTRPTASLPAARDCISLQMRHMVSVSVVASEEHLLSFLAETGIVVRVLAEASHPFFVKNVGGKEIMPAQPTPGGGATRATAGASPLRLPVYRAPLGRFHVRLPGVSVGPWRKIPAPPLTGISFPVTQSTLTNSMTERRAYAARSSVLQGVLGIARGHSVSIRNAHFRPINFFMFNPELSFTGSALQSPLLRHRSQAAARGPRDRDPLASFTKTISHKEMTREESVFTAASLHIAADSSRAPVRVFDPIHPRDVFSFLRVAKALKPPEYASKSVQISSEP